MPPLTFTLICWQVTQAEKTIQEQSNDYQVALQEVRNHQRAAEQLKADLALARGAHAEENSRLNQDITILREDLELTKNDLEDARSQYSLLKSQHEDIKDNYEREQRSHTDAVTEVRHIPRSKR